MKCIDSLTQNNSAFHNSTFVLLDSRQWGMGQETEERDLWQNSKWVQFKAHLHRHIILFCFAWPAGAAFRRFPALSGVKMLSLVPKWYQFYLILSRGISHLRNIAVMNVKLNTEHHWRYLLSKDLLFTEQDGNTYLKIALYNKTWRKKSYLQISMQTTFQMSFSRGEEKGNGERGESRDRCKSNQSQLNTLHSISPLRARKKVFQICERNRNIWADKYIYIKTI